MRLPDVTPEPGASAASNPATPVRKHGGMALVAGGDDMSVEAVLQSLSPTSVKSVVSQAAADAVAEVRIPQNRVRRSVTHRLPPFDHPPPQLQSRLAAAERAQHTAEDRARAVKLDALAASKAHDAERQRWQTHFTKVQREMEAVKMKVEAVKTEHASNLRELVKRNEDLAAVGEALERERETRARCEDRLRKAKNIERGFLKKLAASEDSLELALSTNAEHAAKAARRARKSAHDAATGVGDWDEAYRDVKEELDAVRETLRRCEAARKEAEDRAVAAESRAMNAEAAIHATDTAALVNEVKELRVKQTTMANEVAREVSQRVIEENLGTPVRLAAPTSAPVPVTMTHSTRSNAVTPGAGIDPGHHALLVGQSHRNRAEIDRLTRLYDERGEQLESLRGELRSECDARAEAETRARAAEATTVRLMSLNKNLLDSYQKLLDDKANAAVAAKPPGLKTTEKFSGSFSGSAAPRDHHLSHLPRVARLAHGHVTGAGRDQRVTTTGFEPSSSLRRRNDSTGPKKMWNWNGPGGTPPPPPPRPSRLFPTPTSERGSPLMPSVYHPVATHRVSPAKTAFDGTYERLDSHLDSHSNDVEAEYEAELRKRAEFAEAEAASNRAAADDAMAEVLDGLRQEMSAMDAEYSALLGNLKDAEESGKVPDTRLRANPIATPVTPSARELEEGARRAAWLMEKMEEKGAQIAALTQTLERSKHPRDSAMGG